MPTRSRKLTKASSSRRPVSNGPSPWRIDPLLIEKFLPTLNLLHSYCRVQVEGLHHLPKGPALLAANHTGWIGLDYANVAVTIYEERHRVLRGIVHPLWFAHPTVGDVARRLGLVPARKDLMVGLLRAGELVLVFPEAEQGAFKTTTPSTLYHLQEFKRGFVRAAMATGVPIIPVAIVGGEEANPVLHRLSGLERLFHVPVPVPHNLLPYPVKWRVSFLPPLPMDGYAKRDAADRALVHKIARRVRRQIRAEIKIQLAKRGHKYL